MKNLAHESYQTEDQAAIFAVLAEPTRLKLFNLLKLQDENNAVCVTALAIMLNVTQSAVSQHLRVLKAAGLVKGERRGYHTHYYVNQSRINSIRNMAIKVFDMNETPDIVVCPESCTKVGNPNCSGEIRFGQTGISETLPETKTTEHMFTGKTKK
ncbi:MAG: winged helix-turn-helix transcriptional regulator [Dehalococcoidaceae bacterium]|nr:winged helix-turn-helix transcriptional regulator [Dehalococcoidaceae bacterium]